MKLDGSQCPLSKLNGTLISLDGYGPKCLLLLGGSLVRPGQFNFEIYKVNHGTFKWEKVEM